MDQYEKTVKNKLRLQFRLQFGLHDVVNGPRMRYDDDTSSHGVKRPKCTTLSGVMVNYNLIFPHESKGYYL
jgi:hypothetical protein